MVENSNKLKQKGEIIIYETSNKEVVLDVYFKNETVWLSQSQIVKLFDKDQSVISRHIKNIFADNEVGEKSNMQKMHIANSDKPVVFYSIDIILAIGYRTNSKNAINFRKWATKILKDHLLKGYSVNKNILLENQNKFKELQTTISFLAEKSKKELLKNQEGEILNILENYSKTLTLLEEYDKDKLSNKKGKKTKYILKYEHCLNIILELRKELIKKKEATNLFGNQKDSSFEGIIKGLYQTFGAKELYSTIEDKASHLLYLIIKDHPFSDGNKRSAVFLFIYFLDKTNYLYKKSGEKKINDNALTALALLVAESKAKEKDIIIKLIKNLISE